LPVFFAYQHSGEHGQDTGQVIKSNQLQHVPHIK
jgi:hypothetical protein